MTALLLADEDVLFRTALACVLADRGHSVVAQAGSAGELAERLDTARTSPDVVVASSSLPGGCRAAVRTTGLGPRLLVLGHGSDHDLLVGALDAGAQGYLGKDATLEQLLDAVLAVARGEAVVPPAMLGGLLHELVQQRRRPRDSGLTPLSRREQEVLELLAQGHAQEGIARALVISPQTARTHIQKVIGKLGAHSRVEAVAVAVEHGLVAAS
jgi:DNA-binding NarL/FixJ family response regulator